MQSSQDKNELPSGWNLARWAEHQNLVLPLTDRSKPSNLMPSVQRALLFTWEFFSVGLCALARLMMENHQITLENVHLGEQYHSRQQEC